MRVGIVAGSMSPVHRGHWSLIERASRENERVLLFISGADREGDDVTIRGRDMVEVWERFLVPFLPPNVKLTLGTPGSSPIRKVYETLGEANEMGSVDHYTVYSDPIDIEKRFTLEKQGKYFGDLLKHGQVAFIGVDRTGETDVSGTQMRRMLRYGMRDEFMSLLPEGVDRQGIWNHLALKAIVRSV